MKRNLLLALLMFFSTACSLPQPPKAYQLVGPQVFAMVADKPEGNPGEVVTITPYIADLNGEGRVMKFTIEACFSPGYQGSGHTCATSRYTEGRQTLVPASNPGTVTGLAAPTYVGPVGSFSVTLPALPAEVATYPYLAFPGYSYEIIYSVLIDGWQEIRGVKEILVSTRTTKNQNPTFTDLNVNGVPLSALPTGSVTISPNASAMVPETYEHMPGGTTSTEYMNYTYYVSDGSMSGSYSATPTYTPPQTRPSRGVVIIGVVRDYRGGTSVKILNL